MEKHDCSLIARIQKALFKKSETAFLAATKKDTPEGTLREVLSGELVPLGIFKQAMAKGAGELLPMKQGRYAIALVCVVLGFMLAVQFRTTQDIRSSIPYQRVEDLSQRLQQSEKEREILLDEVHRLRQASGVEALSRETEIIKMGAGVVPLQGQGLVVTIDDSKRPTKPGENPNLYLIHDDDILKVINELWAAGAEAISINDQRLIASSEIRCAGPTLSVNNAHYTPPYEIRAIGEPQTLENALKMRGGVVETLQFWGIQISVKQQNDVVVPAYKGAFRFEYAKPVKEGGK